MFIDKLYEYYKYINNVNSEAEKILKEYRNS